jgi:SAM-dependent methyltransferase
VSVSDEALRHWRDDLAAWAIPQRILDQAPASPWTPERAIFIRRATARRTRLEGISYHRAREALPPGGSVLDVGAGAGAASLPLLDRAGTLIAVDQDQQLLSELTKQAGGGRRKVTTIIGSWPAVAAGVAAVDVVVCHHVLYNVPELKPFIDALDAHARRRVVIEITATHPVARLNPLWERFHGLERPARPTWEDALRTIRSFRNRVHAEREQIEADATAGSWDEFVGFTCRRLCLPPARVAEVAAALTEQGALPTDPSSWSGPNRDVVTLWWDLA